MTRRERVRSREGRPSHSTNPRFLLYQVGVQVVASPQLADEVLHRRDDAGRRAVSTVSRKF